MASRSPGVGIATLRDWAQSLPARAAVLDLGCGHGMPVTELLVAAGHTVFAVDPSPTLVAAFRSRFPAVPVDCASAEESRFFNRTFDAVVAVGVIFLLSPPTQALLIQRVAGALRPGGQFLFTSPATSCQWPDALTGQVSTSLGAPTYRTLLDGAGLTLEREADDEGGNHYYSARRAAAAAGAV